MHSAQILSVLALVGSTVAAPHRRHKQGNVKVVYETVIHTAYVTHFVDAPQPTAAPAPAPSSEVVPEVVVTTTVAPKPEPAPVTTVAPEPVPVTTTAAPVPVSSKVVQAPEAPASSGYMAIVDEYRTKLGLSKLAQSSDREATASKTAQDGNGKMVHQLLPGTFGQVLAPGGPDDFKHVFVGGWLCERPDLPGLNGECATQSEGWMYTSTGHADILTSDSYKNIGCATVGGIWACDLGW